MDPHGTDRLFAASIPETYDRHLVPLIFETYAADLARRVSALRPRRVLEIAAGTGVVTRAMAGALAQSGIVATDLNQPMLDRAAAVGTQRPVEWRQADAMELPFEDGAFDVVVCQFGVMFFPDKARAFAQARRVLAAGGVLLFNVWDRIEENEFADTVTDTLAEVFPRDPPRFLARTPYGYHDLQAIRRDLADGGFSRTAVIETVGARSKAPSHEAPAIGFCQGTPLRSEIEMRGAPGLADATAACADAIASEFGRGPVDAGMQAHIVTVSA